MTCPGLSSGAGIFSTTNAAELKSCKTTARISTFYTHPLENGSVKVSVRALGLPATRQFSHEHLIINDEVHRGFRSFTDDVGLFLHQVFPATKLSVLERP